MNRKRFIKNLLGSAAGLTLTSSAAGATDPAQRGQGKQPPFLVPGDTIGITCPAGPLNEKEMVWCEQALRKWGFKVCKGSTIGQRWQRFGGTDAERAADFQQMLNDPSVKAILFGRGGYGSMRMMDLVDWQVFEKNPKWLIGFSDLTALHCHIHTLYGTPTIHADMASGFDTRINNRSQSIFQVITGQRIDYRAPLHPLNRKGQCTGLLVGGNLSLIAAMNGSQSELATDGKILLIEEVSEYKYTLDRMMMSLKRSGKLDRLAGLVIGGITATKDDQETPFSMSVEQIILEKVQHTRYPVCFNFPSGHISNNMALKLGVHYNLYVTDSGTSLGEVEDPHPTLPVPITASPVQ